MTIKQSFKNQLLSGLLCFAIILSMLPISFSTAVAADQSTAIRVADPSTMDDWKNYFSNEGDLSTENAGGVWMDKSVFTDAAAFSGTGIRQNEDDSFLVALSAIASNMTITGMSNVPTDTILTLDVSGSMNDNSGNNDVAEELVDAANESIAALLSTNKYNRVGVVLYSGTRSSATNSDAAIVLLPLGRYSTGNDGEYLNYNVSGRGNTTETVSLDSDVVYEGTATKPTSVNKEVVGATYIQKGVVLAMNQFIDEDNSVTVEDSAVGSLQRKPVLVLMSDGAPTLGSTNFTNPGQYNLGDGSNSSAALGFVTQLSAAYAKAKIEEKYGTESLFYTLGLGVSNNSIAVSVLDPDNANASTAVNDFWTQYNAAAVGNTVNVQGRRTTVTKIATDLSQNYVDEYFSADGSSGDLASELKQAFVDIVGSIQLQSSYYPTLISENEDLSGYVSFVDRIGEYMKVTDIKGILIGDHLFSGTDLASNFVSGGGNLGTYDNPTSLGIEMVHAVQKRLGIDSEDTARTLIGLAYEYGQLSYTDENSYSNYIGWYANAAGEFLGFYQNGVTVLPEATGNVTTDPAFTIKSYGYLGAVDESHGVSKSDMMYATVQVRENIVTGEQIVTFAVPAALIPVITYEVTLEENGDLADLTTVGANNPIRLVYEVALDDEINSFNVKEVVSAEYLTENSNADGSVNFYTNQWDHKNTTGYGTVNTYSYFNPSRQNDRYYYTEDTLLYADTNGHLYEYDDVAPFDMPYRAQTVYKKINGTFSKETKYIAISDEAEATAKINSDGVYYVPQGNVYVNLDGYTVNKDENKTNTLSQSNIPFVDTQNHKVDDTGYNFYVGATLGNNGRLTLAAETGIRLTKTMAADAATPTGAFAFVLTNTTNTADNSSYPAWLIKADGTEISTEVKFNNGTATVELNADDVLYIGGMTANDTIRITENATAEYIAQTVGLSDADTITVNSGIMAEVEFINSNRGTGNLTIAKEVEHDFGTDYEIPADKTFTMTVTLSGIGTTNATFEARQTDSDITEIKTDENCCLTVTLKHEEQFEIFGLPAGTIATVVEQNPGTGFTASYWDNGQLGDGSVTVIEDNTVSVIVVNDYTAKAVYPVNLNLSGSKYIEDENGEPVAQWDEDYSFTVVLERYGADGWETVDTKTVSKDNQKFVFDMSKETYDAPGVYSYQLYEKTGSINGMLYDNTWHTFSVYVEDANMDGQLEIVRVHSEHANKDFELVNGEYNIVTDFTNVQTVTVPALATIELQKVLKNDSGSTRVSLAGYTFGLYTDMACTIPAAAGNGIYDIDIAPTDAIGEGWIDVLLDQAGTYTFYVKEESGDISEMTYSTEVIKVVIEVSASDTDSGVLVANVSYYDSDGIPYTLGDDGEVEITNTYDPTDAELVIDFVSKQLNGRAMTQDDVFTFEVQDLNGTPLLEGKNNASGVVTFNGNLKYDKVGTYYYNIVETSVNGDGITTDKTTYRMVVSVSDHDGVLSAQYVLVNVIGNEIVFKNSYIAEPAKHIISGNKTLSGRVLLNDEFSFVLTDVSYNGVAVSNPSSWTVHNFADGSFKFPEMTYTKAGTYIYSVSEIIPDSGKIYGITYDTASYYVTVVVEDNGEGSLEIVSESYSLIDGAAATALTFANTYIPEKTTAQFTGDKELTGKVNNALLGGEYAFTLYASDANWTQGSKIETVNNGVNGLIEFTAIDFETDEDKYYIVKENNAGETIDGVTYDDTVYRVWVEVTDDLKGQLHATVHIYDDYGVPQEEILFINTYEVTGSDTVSLSGTKTINGRVLASDDVFTFELYEADENFAIGSEVKDTAKNDTVTGTYKFNISYTAENVGNIYYYVIKEKDAGKTINGVTNSTAEYHITVKVEDDDKGGIKTTVIIENATASTLDFVNEYKPNAVTKQFEGTKELTGKTLTDDVFQFELYASDADWTEGTLLQTKFNTDGKFVFDEIEFTTVEDKYYLVVEKYAGETINGITYDDTVYRVFVDVSDNLKGNLTATVSFFKNDGSSASEIEFTNKYDITGMCSVELSGEKSMDGRPLTADDIFTFEVYEADKKFETLGNEPVTTVDTNVVTGKFSLSITYSADDVGKTYYYVVKEKNAGETVDGITYSTQKYNVTVTVDDNGVGGVKATATVNDGAVTVDALDFTNKYEPAKAVKVFEGTKTLDGIREIKANDFTFDLYLTNEDFAIESTAVQSVKNDKEGNFKFDEVEFTAVGTYYFVVKENSQTPIGGVTYDASVYHITVKVTDNGKGQLEVSETSMLRVNGNTSEKAQGIAFVNEYSATDVTVSLGGEKKLTGRQLTDGEFKFLLYSANSEFAIAEDATVMEALNKADGSFTFDALTFSQPGMYYYVIREDVTVNAERITFDNTVYRITIEVKDNENGKLTASEPIIVKAETVDTVDSVVFENVYTPKPTDISVDIKVHKTVVNKGSESITPKDFEFILESVTDSTDRLTVKTDKDGDAIFTLTFTENDIGKSFNYKLSEVNSGRANIQYSTTEYAICITVSLDDNNNLVTTITNNDAAVTEVVAEFENVYDYTPENPGDPDDPDNPDDPDVPDNPQTGDNTNLGLWFALLFISGGAIIILTVVDRKRRITGKR